MLGLKKTLVFDRLKPAYLIGTIYDNDNFPEILFDDVIPKKNLDLDVQSLLIVPVDKKKITVLSVGEE